MNPYKIVQEFEQIVADYTGANYGIAVRSCTDAIYLSLLYRRYTSTIKEYIYLPKFTYVGVAYAALNAGYVCKFYKYNWERYGKYRIEDNTNIYDSARLLTRNMCKNNTPDALTCLSFHWSKHLKIGQGGMIVTNDLEAADILKKMRYDGRTEGVMPSKDNFIYPAIHSYMIPEEAARGIMLMKQLPDNNEPIPWDEYPDLSKYPIFQEGYK